MNPKDKKVTKGTILAAADAAAAAIHPGVALAWGMAKALFGAGMQLREDRALDFIDFIQQNPSFFVGEILESTEFQDAFVFTLENFIRERSQTRREVMKRVFLGFTTSSDKEEFPLERYIHTITQLSEKDIEVFAKVDPSWRGNPNYQIEDLANKYVQNVYNLIGLGILHDTSNGRTYDRTKDMPFIELSEFGSGLRDYLNA